MQTQISAAAPATINATTRPVRQRPWLVKNSSAVETMAWKTQGWLNHVAARGRVCNDRGVGSMVEKKGLLTKRLRAGKLEEDVIALGGACSEVFSGPRLAAALRPAVEWQQRAVEALAKGEGCAPSSIHTSMGFPAPLGSFLDTLEKHLPWEPAERDWFVNFQLDGATAVWAAIEALMHLRQQEFPHEPLRSKIAVAERSYHGPKSTSAGLPASPRWPGGPRTEGQICYPAPMDGAGRDPDEALRRFDAFLQENGKDVGVILFEPQWGSSACGLPWPKEVLQKAVRKAKEYGIYVLCDEIMCGLGRHGQGTLFLSRAWDLEPDAVTFGKAIACGFPMSGCLVQRGGNILHRAELALLQSHTYAGSSAPALLAARATLRELPNWFAHARHLGQVLEEAFRPINDGTFIEVVGQGLMWGGRFLEKDPSRRQEAVKIFQERCAAALVSPYFVPIGGFMLSPPMDVDEGELLEGVRRLVACIRHTKERMEWHHSGVTSNATSSYYFNRASQTVERGL